MEVGYPLETEKTQAPTLKHTHTHNHDVVEQAPLGAGIQVDKMNGCRTQYTGMWKIELPASSFTGRPSGTLAPVLLLS